MRAGAELPGVKVATDFHLVKKNDHATHPFESISGGDGKPVTITHFDERTGAVLAQTITYEPQQLDLAGGAKL